LVIGHWSLVISPITTRRAVRDRFQEEHAALLRLVQGAPGPADRAAYAALLLRRLVFAYFLQKKGLLDGDADYLRNRLAQCRGSFYRRFLRRLFHEGLAQPVTAREAGLNALLGRVPYLPGLFQEHPVERAAPALDVPEEAFDRTFAFLERFRWRLGEHAAPGDGEIGPDVLGALFECHVNRKEGAYYTGDDITGYMARNALVPFLLDDVARSCPAPTGPGGEAWRLLSERPDRYIPEAVRTGVDLPLPEAVRQRRDWDRPAAPGFALPAESWCEHVARRGRCLDLRHRLAGGEVHAVNDLVTLNLDLRRFTEDLLRERAGPGLLLAFWRALGRVAVLDAACGAGAFLLAALDVLRGLSDACADGMRACVRRPGGAAAGAVAECRAVLARCDAGRNVVTSILANNLHGVDLLPEAVEVCKARLLLEGVASLPRDDLERLDGLALDVQAGNALAGRARPHEPRLAGEGFDWPAAFPHVLSRGGFDVVLGNPPYVPLSAARGPVPSGYECAATGNLYALMVERCLALCREEGRLGLIVPVSSVASAGYAPLQRLLAGRDLWYSSFDDRPSRLFEGLEHARLTIHLLGPRRAAPARFSTRYHKWYAPERATLFDRIVYAPAPHSLLPGALPKLCSPVEAGILDRLAAEGRSLRSFRARGGPHRIFYSRKVGYFLQVLDFEPRVLDGRGQRRPPSEFKELRFASARHARLALGCLNSGLFYWFVTVFSDCRHLNRREIDGFLVDLDRLAGGGQAAALEGLAGELMADLKRHAEERRMCFRHDTLTVQCIVPRRSKPILDALDAALARHYGLSEEQLDFVVGYDVKYRLGAGGGGGGADAP
jgi:hypothetical protein